MALLVLTQLWTDKRTNNQLNKHSHGPIQLKFRQKLKQGCAVALGIAALTLGLAPETVAQTADQTVAQSTAQTITQRTAQTRNSQVTDSSVISQANPASPANPASQANPVSVPGALPALPTPIPTPFLPLLSGITDLSANTYSIQSVGQLRPRDVEALAPDGVGWLQSMILPLYVTPGGEPWGWIYQGWLIPNGQPYLAIGRDAGFAMVRAYDNLYTFPVLEAREDGWFRVQYTPGGSAWAHASQLSLGAMPLVVEGWETQLQAQDSVYFLQTNEAQALRSQPEIASNMLGLIPSGSLIEPLSFQGDWMQARVTRPASACRPLAGATVAEGWMRWRGDKSESLVWYRPEGGCGQAG
jgi:hypothetical protein